MGLRGVVHGRLCLHVEAEAPEVLPDNRRARCLEEGGEAMKCACGAETELKRQEAFAHYLMRMWLCPNCGRYDFDEKDLQEAGP